MTRTRGLKIIVPNKATNRIKLTFLLRYKLFYVGQTLRVLNFLLTLISLNGYQSLHFPQRKSVYSH